MKKQILVSFIFLLGWLFPAVAMASDSYDSNPVLNADTVVLSGTTHTARTLDCDRSLLIFDRGGADNDGVYVSGYAATNWYYIRTTGSGTPLHIQVDATLASNCSLTVYNEYPSDDQAASPSFNTAYPGDYGIYRAESGTSSGTVVSTTGKVSIRFTKSNVTGSRTCNYRIFVWTSDTSEVYDITNSNITSTSASVSWSDSSNATEWTVNYGTSASDLTNSVQVSQTTTAELTGLTPNTPYYYRVYNNAQTTQAQSGYCTRNDGYLITQTTSPVPVGCLGDFTLLDADHVICTYGHYDNPDEHQGIVQGRHTLVTDVGVYDPVISDSLLMVPEGATASVRLGNSNAGNEAESIIYRFRVDAAQNDMLLLQYAAVLQNPTGHSFEIQPRLSLQILRADGSEIDDNCYKTEFVASSAMTTGAVWHDHGVSSGAHILWHDWSAVGVDLTPLDGEELYIKLTTRDCNEAASQYGGSHYGYAYFTLECCKKAISYRGCGSSAVSELVAPAGFSYNWHLEGDTTTVSTERELTLQPGSTGTYECTMTFHGSSSAACSFSMTANPLDMLEIPHAQFEAPQDVQAGTTVAFVNTSFLSSDEEGNNVLPSTMVSYQWNFGDGYTSTDENPTHLFPELANDRVYTVTLTATSESACQSQFQMPVLVYGTGVETPYSELLSDACLVADTAREWAAPQLEWTSPQLLSTYTIPLVGDLNGDGHPNIVCMAIGTASSDTRMINIGNGHRVNNTLAVFDGVTKELLTTFKMSNHNDVSVWADEFSVAPYGILRVKVAAGGQEQDTGLIIVATRSGNTFYSGFNNSYYLQAYDIHGNNIWTSSAPYGSDRYSGQRREYPATVSFADFNGDGYPEVYVRNKIFDAATGQLLVEVTSDNGNQAEAWAHKCGSTNYNGILSAPFAADLSGDGLPELIVGNEAYHIEIANRYGTTGNSATLYATHTPPNNNATDGHVQVADFNADGYLDVLVSSRKNYVSANSYTYYYVWDVHNDVVSDVFSVANNNSGKSIPLVADIDNDGMVEVVAHHPRQTGNDLQALKYNPVTRSFSEMWGRVIPSDVDDSWSNTLTMFDFNGDGINELLFSGRGTLYVLEGPDGSENHELEELLFGEVTIMDYPVIADIDNDGSVEIITIDSASHFGSYDGHLHVFQSSGVPWSAGRPVWNQYMYNATCVNNDLTIPAHPVSNALSLTDPEGVTRRPFNSFLQQIALLDLYGRPSQPAADLYANYGNGAFFYNDSIYVEVYMYNEGQVEMSAPFGITVYDDVYRGVPIDTVIFDQSIAVGSSNVALIALPEDLICSLTSGRIVIAVNDNGGGVAQHGNVGQQGECDTLNNIMVLQISQGVQVSYDTSVACSTVFPFEWHGVTFSGAGTEQYTSPNPYGCDSVVTLTLTLSQCTYDSVQTLSACDSLKWEMDGITYYATTSEPTVTLQGTNGDPDTVVTLNLTVYYATEGDTSAVACGSYDWYEHTGMTTSQEVTHTFESSAGCDSVVTLTLTVAQCTYDSVQTLSACDSLIWALDGLTYYATTVSPTMMPPSATLQGVNGDPDTVVTLHLTVNYSNRYDTALSVCDSIPWNGHTYAATGIYDDTLTNAAGCDSVVTLNLTVHYATEGDTSASVCGSYDWYEHTGMTTSQEVTHTFESSDGCDSVVTLSLTVNQGHNWPTPQSGCDQVNYNLMGQFYTYDQDGEYALPFLNTDGCMDTVTLYVTIYHSSVGDTNAVACGSYDWYEHTDMTTSQEVTHTFEGSNGCDSVVTLNLTVYYATEGDTSAVACGSYDWYEHTGMTTSQEVTHTYEGSNGCDSVVTLSLTVHYATEGDTSAVACGSYDWYEYVGMTQDTTVQHTFTDANGCDSVVTLHLTVNYGNSWDTTALFCVDFTWSMNNETYSQMGDYPYYYQNAQGCLDTAILHLLMAEGTHDTFQVVNCVEYEWHGSHYMESGVYVYDYVDQAGCPSADTLFLTLGEPHYTDTTVAVCNEYTWWRNGVTYIGSGTHVYDYTDAFGCASADTLRLTVVLSVTTRVTDTVCDSIVWHGHTYRESDTLRFSTTSSMGCDSIDILELTVVRSTGSTFVVSTCDSYDWYEHMGITESTDTLTHHFPQPSGCDSVVHLWLTVYYSDTSTHITDTACGSYLWNGLSYTASGNYQYHAATSHHCDSVVTLHLTIHPDYAAHHYDTICAGESYQFNGELCYTSDDYVTTFRTVHDCDSLQILHLYVRPRPVANIWADYSCEMEEYWLTASVDTLRCVWSATPGGHQLTGHEHDLQVVMHPRDTTMVTLTVDYTTGRSCPSVAQREIVPIHDVTASIECHPDALSRDQRTLTAVDASVGLTTRAWYVDGVYWGDDPFVVCSASDEAEELILTLVASNDLCFDTAHRIIKVLDETLFVPNVFTPSLSTNATFRAYGKGILEFHIVIYNREGNKVFEGHDIEEAWDGTHDGEACPQASYVYRIRYRGEMVPDGWKDATGSVLLLR